jgi:hypothetical protein
MRQRTKQGQILEQLLHGMKCRYVLCWNGDSTGGGWGPYDCACCITYAGDEPTGCGCVCHDRIEAMASSRDMLMFLLALEASEEMPFIPKNYEDWMAYNRKLKREHDAYREEHPALVADASKCCDACKMVLEQEARFEEHQKDPENQCSKPCGICDEHRAAAAKELKEAQRISEKLARKKKKRTKIVKNNEPTNQA